MQECLNKFASRSEARGQLSKWADSRENPCGAHRSKAKRAEGLKELRQAWLTIISSCEATRWLGETVLRMRLQKANCPHWLMSLSRKHHNELEMPVKPVGSGISSGGNRQRDQGGNAGTDAKFLNRAIAPSESELLPSYTSKPRLLMIKLMRKFQGARRADYENL